MFSCSCDRQNLYGRTAVHLQELLLLQLPRITPHVLRHTFCSRMAAKRMNPKTLQYIRGHSNISVTLDIYTSVEFEDVADELNRVEELKKTAEVK